VNLSSDLEAHGGLYVLHSHLNHACAPNSSARHLDQQTARARLTLVAKRAIAPGEELTITYVDPSMPVRARRAELAPWAFGPCMCERCVEEAGASDASGPGADSGEGGEEELFPDLAKELRAGLGVL